MTYKIKVGTELDTSQIEKQLSDLQKKLNNMRGLSPGGTSSQVSGNYSSAGETARSERVEQMRQKIRQNHMSKLSKDLKEQEKTLDKQQKIYMQMDKHVKNLAEGTDEHTKAIQRKELAEKKYLMTLEGVNKIQKELNSGRSIGDMLGGMQGMGPLSGYDLARVGVGFNKFGMGKGLSEMGRAGAKFAKSPMGIAAIFGGVSRAARFARDSQLSVRTQEERTSGAEANIAGVLSESARLQSQRRGYEYQYYGPERMKAMEMSSTRMSAEKTKDKLDIASDVLKVVGGGLAVASLIAAPFTAGTSLAGVPLGTKMAVGANIISGLGAVGMAASGASNIAGYAKDDRKRSMLLDPEAYDKFIGEKGAEAYKKALATEKQKDPIKMMAQEFFDANSDRMLKTQRAFGLSDEELFKGNESLYARARRGGFSGDIVEQQMGAIQSAGGTTRAGVEGGVFAAQMARGLDLTNAGSLMGKISGRTGGGGEQSKDEIIRMYAEATRIGLDTSEVRTLLQTSADIAYKTGVSGDSIQGLMQLGMPTQSSRGIEAAANALENIRSKTGSATGLNLQFGMAEFGGKEFGSLIESMGGSMENLGVQDFAELSGFDVIEINKDNKTLTNKFAQMGIDFDSLNSDQKQKLLGEMKKISLRKTTRNKNRETESLKLNKLKKEYEKRKYVLSPEERKRREFDISKQTGIVSGLTGMEEGQSYYDLKSPEQQAKIGIESGIMSGDSGLGSTPSDITKTEEKMTGKTGRATDSRIEAQAQDFANQVQFMNARLGELTTAFEKAATSKAWDAIDSLAARLIEKGELTKSGLDAMREAISGLQGVGTTDYMSVLTNSMTGTSQPLIYNAPSNTDQD